MEITGLTEDKRQEYIKVMYHNPYLFAKVLYPSIIYAEPASYHKDLYNIIYRQPSKAVAVLPRGSGKTSILSTIGTAYDIAFSRETFILLMKKTYDQAYWDLDNIRGAVLYTENFKRFFGDVRVERDARDTIIFINPYTNKRTTIVALGSEQDARGRLTRNNRFSKVIFDDVESDKNTETAYQRYMLKKHIYANTMPGLDPVKGKVWAVGTIVHYDSWLMSLVKTGKEQGWDVVFAKARDDEGNPTYPSRFDDDKLKGIEQEYRARGLYHLYMMEYMNTPVSMEEQEFTEELLNSVTIDYSLKYNSGHYFISIGDDVKPVNLFLGVDPSSGGGRDFTGFSLVAVDSKNIMYVIESYHKKLKQNDIVNEVIDKYNSYNKSITRILIEQAAAFRWLLDSFEIIRKKDGTFLPVSGVTALRGSGGTTSEGQKYGKGRIRALALKMHSGVLFIKPDLKELITELRDFPKGINDDVADSLAIAIDKRYIYPASSHIQLTESKYRNKKKRYSWLTGAPMRV